MVAAASDLAPLESRLPKAVPGCTIRFTFGSSGMLAQQIRHGAEFDVFLSANERFVDELVRDRAVDAISKVSYAEGRIGLWSKKRMNFAGLSQARAIAIANPGHAPYGQAAKEALEHEGVWNRVRQHIVYGENVRHALQYARTGNADAAIVAWSLVKDDGGQLLPAEWHKPIRQTAAIPVRSRNPEAAKRFLTFLLSSDGRKILGQAGFSPAPTTPQTQSASPAR